MYRYQVRGITWTPHLHENSEQKTRTGWFKLNDGNLFIGQSPRRFFDSDREFLHTSSKPLRIRYLTFFFWGGGGHEFSSVKNIRENWTSLRDQIYSAEKKEKKSPRRSGLGMDISNTCAKFQGLSLEPAWTFELLCGKVCDLRSCL